jgi:protoheme IX farnesyltransferase
LPGLRPYIALTKPIITLSVSFSALTGYLLMSGTLIGDWGYTYCGVLFLAAGSSAINQIQEKKYDSAMERTCNRPLPAGKISNLKANIWAAFLSLSGFLILWHFTTNTAAILAAITLIWYNLVYTPLKRKTPWAIIPGAFVGAFPPAIGWTAAGGSLVDQKIIFIAFFFFMGQIPHFWLILLKHGKDYQRAGFPSINSLFSNIQISRLTFTWTAATAITAIFLSVFGIIQSEIFGTIMIIISISLMIFFSFWPGFKNPRNVNRAFIMMNTYFLLAMLIIIGDSLLF